MKNHVKIQKRAKINHDPIKAKEYREVNKESLRKYKKSLKYKNNRIKYDKKYYLKNRDKLLQKQKHRHNRAIQLNRKGFKPSVRTSVYKIQPKDWVKIDGEWKETSGVHCKGKSLIVNKKSINIKHVESIYNTGSFIWR